MDMVMQRMVAKKKIRVLGGINISDAFLGVLMFVIIIAAAFMNADTILNYARWGSEWMEMESMKTAASTYRGLNKSRGADETSGCPTSAANLINGLTKDQSIDGAEHKDLMSPKSGRWHDDSYKDAWGNDFSFTFETDNASGKKVPVIISGGIDGTVGTDDDIKVYY